MRILYFFHILGVNVFFVINAKKQLSTSSISFDLSETGTFNTSHLGFLTPKWHCEICYIPSSEIAGCHAKGELTLFASIFFDYHLENKEPNHLSWSQTWS